MQKDGSMYSMSLYTIVDWGLVYTMKEKDRNFELETIATIRNERGTTWIVRVKSKKKE